MYRTAYQSGPSLDVFGPTGTKPCRLWNVSGNVSRSYDKQANGLAVNLSGHSAKMSFPKTKAGLHLTQRYAVFQLKLSPDKQFSMELAITTKDNTSTRRRLTISSSFKSRKFAPLTAQIPLNVQSVMEAVGWVSLCIDLKGVVDMAWAGGGGFRSLESISLGADCKLRKIFTLRDDPSEADVSLPAQLDFPASMDKVPKLLMLSGGEDDGEAGDELPPPPSRSPGKKAKYLKPSTPDRPPVAFGYRVKASAEKAAPQKRAAKMDRAANFKEVKRQRDAERREQEEEEEEEDEEAMGSPGPSNDEGQPITANEIKSVIERARSRAMERRRGRQVAVEEEEVIEKKYEVESDEADPAVGKFRLAKFANVMDDAFDEKLMQFAVEQLSDDEGDDFGDDVNSSAASIEEQGKQDKSSFDNNSPHSTYDQVSYDDGNLAKFLNAKVQDVSLTERQSEPEPKPDLEPEDREEEVYNDENDPTLALTMPPPPPDTQAPSASPSNSFSQSFNYYMEHGEGVEPSNMVVEGSTVENGLDNSPLQASPTHLGNTATSRKSVLEGLESEVSRSRDFLCSYQHLYQQSLEQQQQQQQQQEDEKTKTDEIGQQRLLELQKELEELENSYSAEYGDLSSSVLASALSNTSLSNDTSDDVVLMQTGTWGQGGGGGGEENNEALKGEERQDEDPAEEEEEEEEELDLVFVREGVYQDPISGKYYCLKEE